jgi:hypothetical protein
MWAIFSRIAALSILSYVSESWLGLMLPIILPSQTPQAIHEEERECPVTADGEWLSAG